jgi:hypothetical protein
LTAGATRLLTYAEKKEKRKKRFLCKYILER